MSGPASFWYQGPGEAQLQVDVGPISGTASIAFSSAGVLVGAGALLAVAALTFGGTNTLTGSGALSGSAANAFANTAALRGAGALNGSAANTFANSGTLTGSGALATSTPMVFGGTNTLTGAGRLTGTSAPVFVNSGTLDVPSGAVAVPSTTGGGGYRYFGWTPDEKKKKPVVEVGVSKFQNKVQVKYIAAPEQPAFPIEVLQTVAEVLQRNEVRNKALLARIEELEEEEDIEIIVRYLS